MLGLKHKRWLQTAGAVALAAAALCASAQPSGERALPSRRTAEPPNSGPSPAEPRVLATPTAEPPAPASAPEPPRPEMPRPLPTPDAISQTPEPGSQDPAPAAEPDAEPDLPQAFPLDRFKLLWERSPFARNILPEQKTAAESAEYSLLGIGGLGPKWCALILDKKAQRRMLIFDDAPQGQDRLVRVSESPNLDDVSAEIEIGGAPFKVKYDVAALKAQAVANAPAAQAHIPAPNIKPPPGAPPQPPPPSTPVRVLPRRRYIPTPSPSVKK